MGGRLNLTTQKVIPYLLAAIASIVAGNFEAYSPLDEVRHATLGAPSMT